MPSKRVNVNITCSDKKIVKRFQDNKYITQIGYIDGKIIRYLHNNPKIEYIKDSYDVDTIMNKQVNISWIRSLSSIVPENTIVVGLDLYIKFINSSNGETQSFAFDSQNIRKAIYPGFMKFSFNENSVNALKDYSGTSFKILPETTEITFSSEENDGINSNWCPRAGVYRDGSTKLPENLVGHEYIGTNFKAYNCTWEIPDSRAHKIYNHNAIERNQPYIVIKYEHNPPVAPSNLAPDNTTINPRSNILFTWNSRVDQESFRLQYRHESTSTWNTVTKSTSERSYLLPANTISQTEGKIFWRVQVAEVNGVYSKYVESSFALGTNSQQAPQVIYPVSDYVESGKPITFEWKFVPNTTEEQVESEISINKGNGYVTKNYPSSKQKITEDLEINDSRVVYWKLRVKNQFGEWSPWTDEITFQIIGKPPRPQITSVENNNRPLIRWSSSDQETYRIEILDINNDVVYDSGNLIGKATREYKIKSPLENGKYFIRLTVANVYGVNSPPVEYTHVIDPSPVSQPEIVLYSDDFSITLKTNKDGEVWRNGKYIGDTVDGIFRDYTGANKKKYKYLIRSYENDVLSDSEVKGGEVNFGIRNTLATVENPSDYLVLEFQVDERPSKNTTFSIQGESIDLEGLEYPIFEFGEKKNEVFNFDFMFENYEDVKKFRKLISERKELILRDNRGRIYQGCITILDYEDNDFGYSISSTLVRTGDFYE